ncbi:MAG: hypothetical protein O7D91_03770, partial [Planctomycetota bacterium]|nr:hypothetical protein [Planctomycetota bacterium]
AGFSRIRAPSAFRLVSAGLDAQFVASARQEGLSQLNMALAQWADSGGRVDTLLHAHSLLQA